MRPKFVSTIAVVASLALASCGGGEETGAGSAGQGNSTDRAFVADMIPHHESAIEMAEIAQERGTSEFVKTLAASIIETQSEEIETLKAEDSALAGEGIEVGDLGVPDHMAGMSEDTASLRTAEPFDEAFLEMMIPHHEGAVTMAEVELDKGGDPELRELAEQIISTQQAEIAQMEAELGGSSAAEEGTEETGGHGSGHSG
jgi:uncharacterized protein (DUF305 family)